jgi:capsular exopolysaccharide synthesis family protein
VVQDTRVILVTSSQAGEGKTATTSNIAVVSAQAGKRVLLIDADMRKPQIHHRFNISNLNGLSSVLIKDRTLEECIVPAVTPNLFLLPSGPIPPNPSEMLSSQTFLDLIEQCRNEYDFIVLDSPPVLAVADAMILTRAVDGTVVVVDAQQTSRGLAQKAVESLRQVNARILGVVLNRIPKGKHNAYYYYQYYSHAETIRA